MRDGQIIHIPEAHDFATAKEVGSLRAIADADVVIVNTDRVIKDRFGVGPRAATAEELAAASVIRYVPVAA